MKRTLTHRQRVVQSYWPYMLGLCEELFLDLANLSGKPGGRAQPALEGRIPNPGATDDPDPERCRRLREKWSGVFREWLETEDAALLGLRNIIRNALISDDTERFQALAVRFANFPALPRPPKGHPHLDLHWSDRNSDTTAFFPRPGVRGFTIPLAAIGANFWQAPILFDIPRALAAAVLSLTGKGRKLVCCRQCGRCLKGRSNQGFCPGGRCRRAWHRSQPANREKTRVYMREKMRVYRALEKRRNQTNQKLSGGKHAKATQA
jgi:hypothetical protein